MSWNRRSERVIEPYDSILGLFRHGNPLVWAARRTEQTENAGLTHYAGDGRLHPGSAEVYTSDVAFRKQWAPVDRIAQEMWADVEGK